jgi:hypothetical protein
MIREKEKNNKEGQRYRLKKFEEEGYREAVSSIIRHIADIPFCDMALSPRYVFPSRQLHFYYKPVTCQ